MDESLRTMKDAHDKASKLQEIMDAKEDLAKVNECISYIEANCCYDTKMYDSYIQEVVDKYRGKDGVGSYYNSATDQNVFDYNYNSLIALRNMIHSYLNNKTISNLVEDVFKEN